MRPKEYEEKLRKPLHLSQSGFKQFLEDPQAYRAGLQQESSGFFRGTLTDSVLLGDVDKARSYVVGEFDDYRTKASREWRDEIIASGRTPVKKSELASILEPLKEHCSKGELMSLLYEDPSKLLRAVDGGAGLVEIAAIAQEVLRGEAQKEIWTEVSVPYNGDMVTVHCGALIDFWPFEGSTIWDIKTTSSFSLDGYSRDFWNYGYHIQAAWYRAAAKTQDSSRTDFMHLVLENGGLNRSIRAVVSERLLEIGEQVIVSGLEKFVECSMLDYWTGPFGCHYGEPAYIEEPSWVSRLDTIEQAAARSLGIFSSRGAG